MPKYEIPVSASAAGVEVKSGPRGLVSLLAWTCWRVASLHTAPAHAVTGAGSGGGGGGGSAKTHWAESVAFWGPCPVVGCVWGGGWAGGDRQRSTELSQSPFGAHVQLLGWCGGESGGGGSAKTHWAEPVAFWGPCPVVGVVWGGSRGGVGGGSAKTHWAESVAFWGPCPESRGGERQTHCGRSVRSNRFSTSFFLFLFLFSGPRVRDDPVWKNQNITVLQAPFSSPTLHLRLFPSPHPPPPPPQKQQPKTNKQNNDNKTTTKQNRDQILTYTK